MEKLFEEAVMLYSNVEHGIGIFCGKSIASYCVEMFGTKKNRGDSEWMCMNELGK